MLKILFVCLIATLSTLSYAWPLLPGESGMSDKCTALIGKDKASVCEELSLSDDSFVEKTFGGKLTLNEKEFALGYDFDFTLLFDLDIDQLFGYYYFTKFIGEPEKAVELTELLLKLINNKYGEPDTPPNHPNSITKTGNLERIQTVKTPISLLELWEIGEPESFALELAVYSDGESGICIQLIYRLMPRIFPRTFEFLQ